MSPFNEFRMKLSLLCDNANAICLFSVVHIILRELQGVGNLHPGKVEPPPSLKCSLKSCVCVGGGDTTLHIVRVGLRNGFPQGSVKQQWMHDPGLSLKIHT